MEHVAGRAEALSKDKVTTTDPPPPTRTRKTESIYTKVYASDGKDDREKRAKQREMRQSAVEKLGEKEYRKLIKEVDLWTYSPVDMNKMINKRVKEIQERLETLRQEEEAPQRRTTRSQAGTSTDPTHETEPAPQIGSPGRKNVGRKKPKTQDGQNIGGKSTEELEKPDPKHKDKGEKRPKQKPTTKTPESSKTSAEIPTKPTSKKTVPQGPRHVDDDEFELDMTTGKFIQKSRGKTNDKKDKSKKKVSDTDDASKSRQKKKAVTFTEHETEEVDDDNDLEIVDDEDLDKDYDPDDDDNVEEEDEQAVEEDLDDFDIPPLPERKKKAKEKVQKTKVQKSSTQRRIEADEGIDDETLKLFQKIVGDNFVIRATEEYEDESKEKRDKCLNPVEAAGFRATMKTLALELKKSVRKGKNIRETYTDLIRSTIRVAKAMNYPGAGQVTTAEILASIKDLDCNAWRNHLEGKTKMNPTDTHVDPGEENPADDDLVIVERMLGQEATDAAAAAIKKLPKLLMNDVIGKISHLFGEIEKPTDMQQRQQKH